MSEPSDMLRLRHDYVYPGHPLVIAICIMEKYPNMQEAYKPAYDKTGKPFGFPEALGDSDIPGAGGCVYEALYILKMDDIEQAVKWAHRRWQSDCSNGYKDRYDKGMEQANELEPRFRELRAKWDNKYVRGNHAEW